MSYKTIEKIKKEITEAEALLDDPFYKSLVGEEKIKKFKLQVAQMKKQVDILLTYPLKYNQYFSDDGFIAYESMDLNVMKKSVDMYESDKEKALDVIMDYYSPKNIEKHLFMIRHVPLFQDRIKFIDYALEDYKNGRYYAVVPILLMMIDGIMSDVEGIGFHSEKNNLDVWDSLLTQNSGLKKIQDFFLKSRKKTITEKIEFPYRNGILHGRDLGYDNYEVALKCWVILFAIRDWVISKNTENERKERFKKENQSKTFEEQIKDIQELNDKKEALNTWTPRELTQEYILMLNTSQISKSSTPEYKVIQYFNYWLKNNYGNMVKIQNEKVTNDNIRNYAGKLKSKYTGIELLEYQILDITDDAPSVTDIKVKIRQKLNEMEIEKVYDVRCIYKNRKNEVQVRDNGLGEWFLLPF